MINDCTEDIILLTFMFRIAMGMKSQRSKKSRNLKG